MNTATTPTLADVALVDAFESSVRTHAYKDPSNASLGAHVERIRQALYDALAAPVPSVSDSELRELDSLRQVAQQAPNTGAVSLNCALFLRLLSAAQQPTPAASDICTHDETHRGGAIWTICDQCGKKWADDEVTQPVEASPDHARRIIGEILLDSTRHPFARLLTAYDENGNGWKAGEKFYAGQATVEVEVAAPVAKADPDAARFVYLMSDLAGSNRVVRNALLDRLAVMSYSAGCAAIDAAMKGTP